jgi:hypothetical protein
VTRRGPRRAADFLAQFAPDPAARARDEQRLEREREENLARYREAAAPVLADLANAGFSVDAIGALRQAGPKAKAAVPVLAGWLPQVTDDAVRADIVRALGVRWAKSAAPALVAEFRRVPPEPSTVGGGLPGPRWAVGSALAEVADDAVFDEVADIARDTRYGRDREMVVVALGNMRRPAAVDVLLDLLNDEQVAGHAVMALGKLRAGRARPAIERLLDHPTSWIRQEAKKALKRIEPT